MYRCVVAFCFILWHAQAGSYRDVWVLMKQAIAMLEAESSDAEPCSPNRGMLAQCERCVHALIHLTHPSPHIHASACANAAQHVRPGFHMQVAFCSFHSRPENGLLLLLRGNPRFAGNACMRMGSLAEATALYEAAKHHAQAVRTPVSSCMCPRALAYADLMVYSGIQATHYRGIHKS